MAHISYRNYIISVLSKRNEVRREMRNTYSIHIEILHTYPHFSVVMKKKEVCCTWERRNACWSKELRRKIELKQQPTLMNVESGDGERGA